MPVGFNVLSGNPAFVTNQIMAVIDGIYGNMQGMGDGIADDVFIRIAGTLVRQPRKHKRLGSRIDKTKSHEAAPK
jgi:hypothetical protein